MAGTLKCSCFDLVEGQALLLDGGIGIFERVDVARLPLQGHRHRSSPASVGRSRPIHARPAGDKHRPWCIPLRSRLVSLPTLAMNPFLDESAFAATLTFWRDRDGVSWSVGVPGVVAEFHAPPGSGVSWSDTRRDMTASCEGGAMTIHLRDGVMPVPYDLESRRHGHRVRGVLFCLPGAKAPLASSAVLREVGRTRWRSAV